MHNHLRQPDHKRNQALETLLAELNRDLCRAAECLPAEIERPRLPQVFVVGCPRSGTTLVYQWLAATGLFTYPTNFVARFPAAPWVGERILLLLSDPAYDFNRELTDHLPATPPSFTSRLGKTRGLTAPHEFWYWWRRFLPERETHALSPGDLAGLDGPTMLRELAAWEAVRNQPLTMKGLILNWNLPWLAEMLPDAIFIHIRRDPYLTMQSLLDARRDFFRDMREWYSFRPPQYPDLKDLDPAMQVAGQVWHTDQAVAAGLAQLPNRRKIEVDYEEFCRRPGGVYTRLVQCLAAVNHPVDPLYTGPASFPARCDVRLSPTEKAALDSAWDTVSASGVI
ncbi:sulfotransferase family protein [bacterium CG_4_9_14_3_um_filter_65_15]|nr:MAG: sulfotransferase family protein [bacterium CG_4_9_14_3_um_filter_65_15]